MLTYDRVIHQVFVGLQELVKDMYYPYGDTGRYGTYYAEDRLYIVYDSWNYGLFMVKADSPFDAIEQVNKANLEYKVDKEYEGE